MPQRGKISRTCTEHRDAQLVDEGLQALADSCSAIAVHGREEMGRCRPRQICPKGYCLRHVKTGAYTPRADQ
jgi:hypothetical protein